MNRNFARVLFAGAILTLALGLAGGSVAARDKPNAPSDYFLMKWLPSPSELDVNGVPGNTGGKLSKVQIERFRCTSSGDPTAGPVDISCNDAAFGQDYAPDNEITIAVDPLDPDHLVAGSNDYYYRFNNSTGARQAIVPTGFFVSFDGGATWEDGQIPLRSGNGAGDPSPAFDVKHGVVLMAQLENLGGQGNTGSVSQGDVSVSRSLDGGRTWSEPITALQGKGAGIGPANQAVFWDKEWLTVDNNSGSPHYGRAYVTATRFLNGLFGSYAESPIYLTYSDDGGLTWSRPQEISGSAPTCTYQETGPAEECDESQFSYPVVASDGTLFVHFANGQNDAEWEAPYDFDTQIMVVKSTDGGETFSGPIPVAQLEDGTSDMPYSVIRRQTVWGHQIRWTAIGNIAVDPTDPNHVAIVFADRGTPNPAIPDDCVDEVPGVAPNYDACNAGPGAELSVYMVESTDGGLTWSVRDPIGDKDAIDGSPANAWFPWAAYTPDGKLAIAWDQDETVAPADTFVHMLYIEGAGAVPVGDAENVDVSVTHWAGQYVTEDNWPKICGPNGSDKAGKDCNVFHGDYTGLAIGGDIDDYCINVVWTGLNQSTTSPQYDAYTSLPHTGYRQDAMFARRCVVDGQVRHASLEVDSGPVQIYLPQIGW